MSGMNEMIEQIKQAEGDPEAEYAALLAVHRAAWAREISDDDLYQTIAPALRNAGCDLWVVAEELGSAYGQRESDGTPCYAQMLDYLHYPHIDRLYKDQQGTSNAEVLAEVDRLFRKSFEGPSIRLEYEAFQALNQALHDGTISKADAVAMADDIRENPTSRNTHAVFSGIDALVMGHEIGIADDPDFAFSPIADRAIQSSYGGHGSDFDTYIDEEYLDQIM